ncbi:MAG: hypothetical protein HY902_07330 [Deltaproteobacteria bacterium]|nr:hypothetical protein [Deltaproteobacteria bacterium]
MAKAEPAAGAALIEKAAQLLGVVLGITYPLLLWYGLLHWPSQQVEALVLATLVVAAWLRLRKVGKELRRSVAAAPLAAIALAALALALDDPRLVLALPALVNAMFFLSFLASLRGVPMVERYARLVKPELQPAEVRYCRSVTLVWCGFFVANGVAAAVLAAWASYDTWALFTGILSYAAMGLLFAVEYAVRTVRFGRHAPAPLASDAIRP